VSLDFEDTDIRGVIAALAELMGASVTYGTLPQRTVTLKTFRPVPRDSLRAIFDGLLEANGLEANEQAGIIRVSAVPEPARPAEPREQVGKVALPTQLYVIRLKHAQATEVAAIVNALFGQVGYGFAPPSLSVEPLSEQLRGDLIPPGYPAPEPAEPVVGGPPGERSVQAAELLGDVTIVPDVSTNSLFIRASEQDFETIRSAVDQLDIRPLQVMIEVLIAEVRRDDLSKLGIEFSFSTEGDELLVEGALSEGGLGTLVLRIMQLGGDEVELIFDALSTSSAVHILSRPVLVTSNNHEARILIGTEQPFVQVARTLPEATAARDQIVQYRDVGTQLMILPTINYDGYVSLSLAQQVSQATEQVQFDAPIIATREATTRLLVRDGQTVVIGGLISRQRERSRSGIPLLKDIPFIGALFASSSWRTFETELFLFLTPHILATDEDAERLRETLEQAAPEVGKRLPPALTAPDTAPPDTARLEVW
jgi:general secretion pathway protein D